MLDMDIQFLKGVGERRAKLFNKLGIKTLADLLYFFPRTYEDWSNPVTIAEAAVDEICCIRATVSFPASENRIRQGLTIYKLKAFDETGTINITIFNSIYMAEALKAGEEFLFFGKVTSTLFGKELTSPQFMPAGTGQKIRPIYPLTEGLSNKIITDAVKQILPKIEEQLDDPIDDYLRTEYNLCHIRFALQNIHMPSSFEVLGSARRRLVFEELLYLQLGLLMLKRRNRQFTLAKMEQHPDITEFLSKLPFTLTNAQQRAINDAIADLHQEIPMNRLIQGDVGSGKTAVAAAICWFAAKNGYQSALMAPTEILATQHFRSLSPLLLLCGLKSEILTGGTSKSEKVRIRKALLDGEIDFVVGTHALIEENIEFSNLGLVVTDEQHRFGVAQRARLAAKGKNPHTLVMSATPIPRTLGLIIYGDLDVSVLDELPPGRQTIDTFAVNSSMHQRIYSFIRKNIDEGRQVYIICPLIEDGESELKAAGSIAKSLTEDEFPEYNVGLLHGKMKSKDKDNEMKAFADGEIQILVSTTVVEVGVDVPNATVMVIENAECFGLSQLHQLRGRVGRGKHKSYCILISDAQNDEAKSRLQVMCQTNDGFKIAETDLKLRGPGDFFGKRQHGLPELKIADVFADMDILKETQTAAKSIIDVDWELNAPQHKKLKEAVSRLFNKDGETAFN
jgi:ATP-dependent DNA helicase RecG